MKHFTLIHKGISENRIIFMRVRPLLDIHVFAAYAHPCASEHRAHDYMDAGRLQGPRYPLEGCGGGRECLEHILEVE